MPFVLPKMPFLIYNPRNNAWVDIELSAQFGLSCFAGLKSISDFVHFFLGKFAVPMSFAKRNVCFRDLRMPFTFALAVFCYFILTVSDASPKNK